MTPPKERDDMKNNDMPVAFTLDNDGAQMLFRVLYGRAWNRLRKAVLTPEWTVRASWATDGLCVHNRKEIWLGMRSGGAWRLLLHEVAHAMDPADPPPGHSLAWWQRYVRLLCEYSSSAPTRSDLIALAVQQDWPLMNVADTDHWMIGYGMGAPEAAP